MISFVAWLVMVIVPCFAYSLASLHDKIDCLCHRLDIRHDGDKELAELRHNELRRRLDAIDKQLFDLKWSRL